MTIATSLPAARQPIWKLQILWFALALGLLEGSLFNFLPVSFPVFRHFFGATFEQLGRIQLLFFASGMLLSVGGGWLVGRLGLHAAAIIATLFVILGLLGIGNAPNILVVLIGSFCFGLAIQGVILVSNSIMAENFSDGRQTVFFLWSLCDALGATVGPTVLGRWLGDAEFHGASWRMAYFAVCGLAGLMTLWGFFLRSSSPETRILKVAPTSNALGIMRRCWRTRPFTPSPWLCSCMVWHKVEWFPGQGSFIKSRTAWEQPKRLISLASMLRVSS
jgi:MFS family permease